MLAITITSLTYAQSNVVIPKVIDSYIPDLTSVHRESSRVILDKIKRDDAIWGARVPKVEPQEVFKPHRIDIEGLNRQFGADIDVSGSRENINVLYKTLNSGEKVKNFETYRKGVNNRYILAK